MAESENEKMPGTPVTIDIDKSGHVKKVMNEKGVCVPFILNVVSDTDFSISPELLSKCKLLFDAETIDHKVLKRLEHVVKEVEKICMFPGVHLTKRYLYPRCCIMQIDPNLKISKQTIPLDLSYASCMSLCEIDTRQGIMDIGSAFFNSESVRKTFSEIQDEFFIDESLHESSRCPGVVCKGRLYDNLQKYTIQEDEFWNDPLKKIFRSDFLKDWTPYLSRNTDGHFVSICSSDWERVDGRIKMIRNFQEGTLKFYLVVGWSLPMSLCDQIKHFIKVCSDQGENWSSIVESEDALCYELKMAEKISQLATENILERVLARLNLKKNKTFMTSSFLSNVFRHDSKSNTVNFFNETVCTTDESAEGGALTMRGSSADAGFIWWGGTFNRKRLLGDPWSSPETLDGLPAKVFDKVDGNEVPGVSTQRVWETMMNKSFQHENNTGHMRLKNIISV